MMTQQLRPMAVGSKPFCNLLPIKWPNPGDYTFGHHLFDLGIVWADPADHTQTFNEKSGIDTANGSHYIAKEFQRPYQLIIGPIFNVVWRCFSVDQTGADIDLLSGSILWSSFDNNVALSMGINVPVIDINPATDPFNGLRAEIECIFPSADFLTIRIPETMLFYGV